MSRLGNLGGSLYRGEVSYDFVGRQKRWYTISGVILLVTIGALLLHPLKLGIEFRGGGEYRSPMASCSVAQARTAAGDAAGGEVRASKVGGNLRVQTKQLSKAQDNAVVAAIAKACGVKETDVSSSTIGASWGKDISHKALKGLIVFLILVAIYLAIAFEWRMAVSALVALAHDLVITAGVYALVGFEVTPATVVGILTILGYSLYDTVVVFDKVRENTAGIQGGSRMTYSEAANLAMNQTLVRSINTSIIALLPVAGILFVGAGLLGAGALKDISLALFVGIAAGTYSSIFIATPLLADLKEREPGMKALAKRVAARRSGVAAVARRGAKAAVATSVGSEAPPGGLLPDTADPRFVQIASDDATPEANAVPVRPRTTPPQRTQPQRRPGSGRPSGRGKKR